MRTLQVVIVSLLFASVAHADPVDFSYCRSAVAKMMDRDPLASTAQAYFNWGHIGMRAETWLPADPKTQVSYDRKGDMSQVMIDKLVPGTDGGDHDLTNRLKVTAGSDSYLISHSFETPIGSQTEELQMQVINKVCVPVRHDQSKDGDLFSLKKRGELAHETNSDFGDLSQQMADDPRLRKKVDFTHCNQAISAANPDRQLPSYATTYLNYGDHWMNAQLKFHNSNHFASPGIVDYTSDVARNGQLENLTLYDYEDKGDPKSSREKLAISFDAQSDTYVATDVLARAGKSETTTVRMQVSNDVCIPIEVTKDSYPIDKKEDLQIAGCDSSKYDQCRKIFGDIAKKLSSLAPSASNASDLAVQTR